jgi:hypothetical protein
MLSRQYIQITQSFYPKVRISASTTTANNAYLVVELRSQPHLPHLLSTLMLFEIDGLQSPIYPYNLYHYLLERQLHN